MTQAPALLPHYNLRPDSIIEIYGAPHKLVPGPVADRMFLMHGQTGMPFLREDDDGEVGLPTQKGFDDMLLTGAVVIKDPPHADPARRMSKEAGWTVEAIENEIDPYARKRLIQMELLDDAGVPNGAEATKQALLKLWTAELAAKYGPVDNHHTVKRWRLERGKPGRRTLEAAVSMQGHNTRDQPYWNDTLHESLWRAALLHHANCGLSYADVESEHITEIERINAGNSEFYPKPCEPLEPLSYDTVRRACVALESAAASKTRDGAAMAEANWRGAGAPLKARRALEMAIIDHTWLDVIVLDPDREVVLGRPWLTFMIDVATRVILAWLITFRTPSMWTMGEVIRRANMPKRPPKDLSERYPILTRIMGKPAEIILDNAMEHTGHGMEDAAKGAGFAVRFAPIKKPRYRAIGERVFGTIPTKICRLLPGATRPIAWARKAEYDAQKSAWCTLDEIEAVANQAVAEYHIETHEGLAGRQPALMFQKSVNKHGIDIISDAASFGTELMDVKSGVQLTNSGVRLWGLRFTDVRAVPALLDDLVALEPKRQRREAATCIGKIKYDPENIGRIHFWNRNRNRRCWVTLKCDDQEYADGLPLWLHEQILDEARAEASGRPGRDGEPAIVGFNTKAERKAVRSRRINAIRNIAPNATKREREGLAKLYEIPRLRQITGNLVHVHPEEAHAVTVDEFISHDLASRTSLDDEILAPRAAIGGGDGVGLRRKRQNPPQDRRDAGAPYQSEVAPTPRTKRRVTGPFS